jgi:protein TonB
LSWIQVVHQDAPLTAQAIIVQLPVEPSQPVVLPIQPAQQARPGRAVTAPVRPRSVLKPPPSGDPTPHAAPAAVVNSLPTTSAQMGDAVPAAALNAPGLNPRISAQTDLASHVKTEAVKLPSSDASYLNNPAPTYPPLSRRLGEQGKVVIHVLIGKEGQARQAEVTVSSGFDRLDQAALQTVLGWRYAPGTRDGLAQDMWFNVPVNFKLN